MINCIVRPTAGEVVFAIVLAIHEGLISQYGGLSGVRDYPLLEASLASGEIDENTLQVWLAKYAEKLL